jgi:molybdopterin/thiamine biosynthesis adenylyltransferase/rhodanese-related sulfurtransferase
MESVDFRERTEPASRRVLSGEQLERYSRQILLPEIGIEGQNKLLSSKVAIVGAGGLGAPASIYLAAAGIGTIGLIDADHVDLSNLQRQILHFQSDVGRPKTSSGKHHLQQINSDVTVIEHNVRLTSDNVTEIFSQYDVIVNGSDNFPTRYLVNDACLLLKKPLVDASILKWEGNLHVFQPGYGCYRCLFPEPPAPGTVPSCAEAGIVGALAGVMGSMQAMETIKVILDMDTVLRSRSFYINLMTGNTRIIRRSRRGDCALCGDDPSIDRLIDYEHFCGIPSLRKAPLAKTSRPDLHEIRIEEALMVQAEKEIIWLDVRKKHEFVTARIPGSIHIELEQLKTRAHEIPRESFVICVCEIGMISASAVVILQQAGITDVHSLAGGILEWENRGLSLER